MLARLLVLQKYYYPSGRFSFYQSNLTIYDSPSSRSGEKKGKIQRNWVVQGSQVAYPLPKSDGPCKTGPLVRENASMWRHTLCAAPTAPRITSQITWPKIKSLGRGKVTRRLQHHHLQSQLRRQVTKSYLINITVPKIHTCGSVTAHDGRRGNNTKGKQSTGEKTPGKEGERDEEGLLEGRQTWGHALDRCEVRPSKLSLVKPALVRPPQSSPCGASLSS